MGSHGAPTKVYGPSRMRWLAPLLVPPASAYLLWTTVLSLCGGAALLITHLWLPGLVLVGLAAVVVALVVAGRIARPRMVLADREYVNAWQNVEKSCTAIQAAWPTVRGMTGVRNVLPVIQNARWDLARLIARRGRLSKAQSEAKFAEYGLDPDDPLRDELATRRDQLAVRLSAMDAEIAARISRLRSLADQCAHFAYHQAALRRASKVARRARQAVQDADSAILSTADWQVRPDPVKDISERTEAVSAAYRELAAIPALPPRLRESWSPPHPSP